MAGSATSGTPRRPIRRLATALVTIAVAVAGGVALLLFFASRDAAPVDKAQPKGPGQAFPDQGARHLTPGQRPGVAYNSSPPTSGPHVPAAIRRDEGVLSDDQILHALEQGNVVLVYGTARPPAGLRALADEVAGGPFDPGLASAGQSVILARRPGARGIVALAWRHLQRAGSASDPALRQFASYWLGRGPQ